MTNYNYPERLNLLFHFSEKVKKGISIVLFFSFVIPIFLLKLFITFENSYFIYLIIFSILLIVTYFVNIDIFSTVLFFYLLHATTPLNTVFVNFIGINFLGTYFLIPVILFSLLILTSTPIRHTIDWWQKDYFNLKVVILIIFMSFISGFSLYLWGSNNLAYISNFASKLPRGSFVYILLNGIAFAALNAIAEEYISRGMLCNGLDKLFENTKLKIVIQAILFSVFHYYGFPGGLVGVGMVFTWSIFLGAIRYWTKGLLGVLISHFLADLTIYYILYSLF